MEPTSDKAFCASGAGSYPAARWGNRLFAATETTDAHQISPVLFTDGWVGACLGGRLLDLRDLFTVHPAETDPRNSDMLEFEMEFGVPSWQFSRSIP